MHRLAELSRYLIPAFWLIWLAGWAIAARDVKPTRWRESTAEGARNRIPVLIGAVLIAAPQILPAVLSHRLLPPGAAGPAVGTLLVGAGLGFAGWSRWHLGRNWSGNVTVKEGHTLIRSGPYRLVRHPIYSGMVLALFGTALAIGEARAFIGAALILIGFVLKLQVEEARMRETFPEYIDYSRRTARLIPGLF
jgi:protein-S-isoprenylcysteine O-methyltransferase Ste14